MRRERQWEEGDEKHTQDANAPDLLFIDKQTIAFIFRALNWQDAIRTGISSGISSQLLEGSYREALSSS